MRDWVSHVDDVTKDSKDTLGDEQKGGKQNEGPGWLIGFNMSNILVKFTAADTTKH